MCVCAHLIFTFYESNQPQSIAILSTYLQRDFSLKAEKETDHNLESADSRDEKRWMKSEIDRKMKKMKKDEVARVGLLVERASKF